MHSVRVIQSVIYDNQQCLLHPGVWGRRYPIGQRISTVKEPESYVSAIYSLRGKFEFTFDIWWVMSKKGIYIKTKYSIFHKIFYRMCSIGNSTTIFVCFEPDIRTSKNGGYEFCACHRGGTQTSQLGVEIRALLSVGTELMSGIKIKVENWKIKFKQNVA